MLLAKTEIALILINRKVLLHNVQYLCPFISTHLYNNFLKVDHWLKKTTIARGNNPRRTKSKGSISLGLIPLVGKPQTNNRNAKHIAFAGNLGGTGKLEEIYIWWKALITEDPNMVIIQKYQSSFHIDREIENMRQDKELVRAK